MPGKGTAWFDLLEAFEAVDINRSINPEILNNYPQPPQGGLN